MLYRHGLHISKAISFCPGELDLDQARIIKAAVPHGARFKGYEGFVVQDLVMHAPPMPRSARLSDPARAFAPVTDPIAN